MSDETRDADLTPAQQALSAHLDLLRSTPPTAAPELIAGILRRTRWQIAIRDPLIFVASVSAAIAEGVSLLAGPAVAQR